MEELYILSVTGQDIALDNFFCVSKYFYSNEVEARNDIDNFISKCSDKKYLLCLDTKQKYKVNIIKLRRSDGRKEMRFL